MKAPVLILGFLISIQSFGQEGHYNVVGDTLIITNSEFLNDPFQFGKQPSDFLMRTGISMEQIPTPNLHVKDQIDTLIKINHGIDSFQVYKNPDINVLVRAEIFSQNFLVQKSIRVGMNKPKVKKELKVKGEAPNIIRIRDLEFTTWLDLYFENRRLSRVCYVSLVD